MAAARCEINAGSHAASHAMQAEASLRALPTFDTFWRNSRYPVRKMAEWFVAKNSEMKDGDRRIVVAGQREIGVFHKDGRYYAYSNNCLHQGGPACEGLLIANVVDLVGPDRTYEGQAFGDEMHFVCPWHGWEYDLTTGEMVGDRKQKLRKYEVVTRGDDVYVIA
jgi:nitrite reductase/ring-hydroxylating ferredoxin subunit